MKTTSTTSTLIVYPYISGFKKCYIFVVIQQKKTKYYDWIFNMDIGLVTIKVGMGNYFYAKDWIAEWVR